ncbi:cyclic pyranopterin monophosphate synthase MoaC [Methanohalophilus sp. DAL1]|uniref:cyclic pyranopterin monophosphate synthase MoaC n=1 Tax=Methanohalophilus sp. DAL1 TaxID=1864608 RepID=UPI0025BE1426|nr:cyclic pyranopterin monophosphate synthase MoaC [Methanohalophilus sp. DAL1]
MGEFTHIKDSHVHMVDVSGKSEVKRTALARGSIFLCKETIEEIQKGYVEKGNVLATARIAAIMAVKKTPELIPMCHQIPITGIDMDFEICKDRITVNLSVKSRGQTGVEMEAITGVSCALLAIWDMVKALEKDETGNYPHTRITDIEVIHKVKES